jgi:hypothetical protein
VSNADKIRAAMGSASMTAAAIAAASGVPKSNVSVFLAEGQRRGEIEKIGEEAPPYEFQRVAGFTTQRGKARAKPANRPKRLKGFKAAARDRKAKTVRDLVRTLTQGPDRAAVAGLIIDGYTTSVQTLRNYLLEHVDGLDGDAVLQSLIKQTEANEKIVLAGRAA